MSSAVRAPARLAFRRASRASRETVRKVVPTWPASFVRRPRSSAFDDGSTASSSSVAPRYAAAAMRSTSAWVCSTFAAALCSAAVNAATRTPSSRLRASSPRCWACSAASWVWAAASSADASAPVPGTSGTPSRRASMPGMIDPAPGGTTGVATAARRPGAAPAASGPVSPSAVTIASTTTAATGRRRAVLTALSALSVMGMLRLRPSRHPRPDAPFCLVPEGTKSANRAGPEVRVASVLRFDPYSYEHHEDPYPTYRQLRDGAPAYLDPERGFWALSRHDDVRAAIDDWPTFSSSGGITLERRAENVEPMLIEMDPPRHTELRSLVSRAFTPRRVADLEGPDPRAGARALRGLRARPPGRRHR